MIFILAKIKNCFTNTSKNSMFVFMQTIIYHIATKAEWFKNLQLPYYTHHSLEKEGFIHCCYDNQIDFIIDHYFKHEKEVFIIGLKTSMLDVLVKEEASSNGQSFPHIYGTINRSAIDNWEIRNKK
jgi:uncharacterized protein (DUF952 family)